MSPKLEGDSRIAARATHNDLIQVEGFATYSIEMALRNAGNLQLSGSFNFINFYNSEWASGESLFDVGEIRTFDKFNFPINLKVNMIGKNGLPELAMTWNHRHISNVNAETFLAGYLEKLEMNLKNAKSRITA